MLDLPDFGWWVAAPLLDVPLAEAEDTVEQLVDLRLLDVAGVDGIGRVRYRFHDLVKLFGAEHALAAEPAGEIVAAVSRVLATWMALVETASRRLPKVLLGQRLNPAPVVVAPLLVEEVEDDPAGWFSAETAAMVRAVERAAELGIEAMTTLLVTALVSSPRAARNEFDGWRRTHEVALAAARARGNRHAEAMLLAGLGELYYEKDEFAAARNDLETAAELGRRIGDDGGIDAAAAQNSRGGLDTLGLAAVSVTIERDELRAGDVLLRTGGSRLIRHVTVFGEWADQDQTAYWGFEQSGGAGTVHRRVNYPFDGREHYLPRRYLNVVQY